MDVFTLSSVLKCNNYKNLKSTICLYLLYLHLAQPKFLNIRSVEARKHVLLSGSLKLGEKPARQCTATISMFGGDCPTPKISLNIRFQKIAIFGNVSLDCHMISTSVQKSPVCHLLLTISILLICYNKYPYNPYIKSWDQLSQLVWTTYNVVQSKLGLEPWAWAGLDSW